MVPGFWLAVDAYLKQGPTITLYFPDAEGLQADKTLVKVRAVTVGTVTGVRLADDLAFGSCSSGSPIAFSTAISTPSRAGVSGLG